MVVYSLKVFKYHCQKVFNVFLGLIRLYLKIILKQLDVLQPWVNIPIFVEGRLLEYLWGINLGGGVGGWRERGSLPSKKFQAAGQRSMRWAGSVLLTGEGDKTEVAGR